MDFREPGRPRARSALQLSKLQADVLTVAGLPKIMRSERFASVKKSVNVVMGMPGATFTLAELAGRVPNASVSDRR